MVWVRRASIGLILVLAVAASALYAWLRLSLPQLSGEIALAGLDAPVEIHRDGQGIPVIRAGSERDAYRALGFVHAQDRLWQMELIRRTGAGRLSELFGQATVDADRFLRTLGFMRLAEGTVAQLSPPLRQALEAYAGGVNAFIRQANALPPEFAALGATAEPWLPAHSLVWGRLMAYQLSNNWTDELLRTRLSTRLTAEQIEVLWPVEDAATQVPVADAGAAAEVPASLADALLDRLPASLRPVVASNIWVLAGSHTSTGKPVLANDPHLGFSNPNLWYLARIETPELTLSGATVPGTPVHLLGHNGHIAWGFTTTHSDTQDLFVERLAADDDTRYLTPAGTEAFAVRTEIIRQRGGADIALVVRETRHGPVISDIVRRTEGMAGASDVVALAATSLLPDDRTAEAVYHLNRARNWEEFVAALRDFHAPQQNIGYADRAGHVGFLAPGRVPIRRAGDGRYPARGASGERDWVGFVPFDALPRHLDPPSGRIVNANNRIVEPNYPHLLSTFWFPPYRARRIAEAIEAKPRHAIADAAALQLDHIAVDARDLLPNLLAVPPRGEREKAAVELLARWDFAMARGRPEPLIYMAWLNALSRGLYADELGPHFVQLRGARTLVVQRMLTHDRVWCDDIATKQIESCDDVVAAALSRALAELTSSHGKTMTDWRWGDAHRAIFRHEFFGHIPILGSLTDIEIATDGGAETVNRGDMPGGTVDPYRHVHGAGFRAVYDLSDLDRSLFIQATGQSGHLLSPHYRDLVERWRDGHYVQIPAEPRGPGNLLRLRPSHWRP
ncbi:MAG: penicillin acylase family protein [Alphaproteobacteria bacterium]|nr:penicillin acylase family protein [Alphaproteobacteria bacterium]